MHFDVFNGDADGICALIQLRLTKPLASVLVTGVKRDINLLDKIKVNKGDQLTVLDVSLQKNHQRLVEFLAAGASIFYVDHHLPGEIPCHLNLKALIDTGNEICTSLLIHRYIGGKFPLWAITAAFGDNLNNSALELATAIGLGAETIGKLKKLGTYVNYNSYGNSLQDLHFAPDTLYREMVLYASPLEFIHCNRIIYETLENGFQQDMKNAENIKPQFQNDSVSVYVLPDTAWARRVSGVLGNKLSNANPFKAHAVLTSNREGFYTVSVRAPLTKKFGAGDFCSRFSTGGGRAAAAGINQLPKELLDDFIIKFAEFYC